MSRQDPRKEDRKVLTDSTPDTLLSLRKAHVGDSHPLRPDRQPSAVVQRPRGSQSHITFAIRCMGYNQRQCLKQSDSAG